ncbi:hypothetical protein J4419_00545 [Candidatus Woesearchaeota archaeon]|nr:hypothetical protein [Candidatus Woesearchaeota archaeon]
MGQIDNKMKWCLNKAEREGAKHRGLKRVHPDPALAKDLVAKAQHNLKAASYNA